MLKLKITSRKLLNFLYNSANQFSSNLDTSMKKFRRKNKVFLSSNEELSRYSTVPTQDTEKFQQFEYKTYDDIVNEIFALEKEFPDLVRVSTAQERYKLPYPGGICKTSLKSEQEKHKKYLH